MKGERTRYSDGCTVRGEILGSNSVLQTSQGALVFFIAGVDITFLGTNLLSYVAQGRVTD